jgi:hypothetical protein
MQNLGSNVSCKTLFEFGMTNFRERNSTEVFCPHIFCRIRRCLETKMCDASVSCDAFTTMSARFSFRLRNMRSNLVMLVAALPATSFVGDIHIFVMRTAVPVTKARAASPHLPPIVRDRAADRRVEPDIVRATSRNTQRAARTP